MMSQRRKFMWAFWAVSLAVGVASADTYTPNTAQITWYNNFIGQRTATDTNASVTVTYLGGGAYSLSVSMTGSEPGIGTYTYNGIGSGTIAGTVASGTMNWSGLLASYPVTNNGGPYSCTVTGGGGTAFGIGDVLALTAIWGGTAGGGAPGGNWDHWITGPGCSTCITFGARLAELYSDDDWQYYGPGANGQRRSQHFSPTQSTPNSLGGADTFTTAEFRITLDAAEGLTGTLELFSWAGDYTTTIGGTPLGSTPVNLTGPTDVWIGVTASSGQAASNQYLLSLLVGTVTGTDFGMRRSNSDDGGPNNNAYTGTSLRTDREHQVRLSGGSLPVGGWESY